MFLLNGKDAAARIQGIIQEKYQVHRYSVDLTVKSISQFDPVGQVDFGGGEYRAASHIRISPSRMRPEDRYEWWDLDRGSYAVTYNETLDLKDDEIALIEPDPRLLRAGGTHTVTFLRGRIDPVESMLIVGVSRLQIKQNARISCLRLFALAGGIETPTPLIKAQTIAKSPAKTPRKRR
jgi:deoxycytidine triphosphate deaminase